MEDPKAKQLQRAIAALRGVRGVVVDALPGGRLQIKVLVVPERSRSEIRELVAARVKDLWGKDVDQPEIHILGGGKAPERIRRRILTSVVTERCRDHFTARVALELDGDILTGEQQGERGDENRVIVEAVLHALGALLHEDFILQSVEKLSIGENRMAVVWLDAGGRTLSGSALLKSDEQEMLARATLHALNRQIGRHQASGPPVAAVAAGSLRDGS